MPVIFVATIPIRVNRDRSVDILSKIKDEVKSCGCINVGDAAKKLNVSLEEAHTAAKQLAGDAVISCDDEGLYCCTDEGRLDSFMSTLRNLRGGT